MANVEPNDEALTEYQVTSATNEFARLLKRLVRPSGDAVEERIACVLENGSGEVRDLLRKPVVETAVDLVRVQLRGARLGGESRGKK